MKSDAFILPRKLFNMLRNILHIETVMYSRKGDTFSGACLLRY